jgi:lipopolysaccharide export system protein LptA
VRTGWFGALARRCTRSRQRYRASSHLRIALAGALCLLATPAFVAAQGVGGQDSPSTTAKRLTVERDDTTIVVTQQADNVTGARFLLRNPNCDDENYTSIFYAPSPGENRTVVAGDTTLFSRLVIVREPRDGEDAGSQSLDLIDADVTFNRPGCIETMEPVENPRVELRQGRTTIAGSRFTLDQDTELGTMEGPVALERAAEGDSPALSATADGLELDVETEITTLVGNVEVRSEDRISEAARLELREREGIAILSGSPARTRVGADVIEGETLRYYLDTNDVVVIGNVKGTFDLPE